MVSDSSSAELQKLFQDIVERAARRNPELSQPGRPNEDDVAPILRYEGRELANKLIAAAPGVLADRLEWRQEFEAKLRGAWGEALDLFEMFVGICQEAGDSFNRRYRDEASNADDTCFEAFTRLHARSCLVGAEVLALLRSGFGSGAYARWRTIHELAVVAQFIKTHGAETANRFLLHDGIQTYKIAQAFRRHEPATVSDEEFAEFEERRNVLVARFGTPFKEEYGWAAYALGKKRPTFASIEEAVELDRLRPVYRTASDPVHANIRGAAADLGVPDGAAILLAGPSVFGLSEAGDNACVSLIQVTVPLLQHKLDVEGIVVLEALLALQPRVGQAFVDAGHRVQAESRDADDT
jgi:hypothetical protein